MLHHETTIGATEVQDLSEDAQFRPSNESLNTTVSQNCILPLKFSAIFWLENKKNALLVMET